MTKQHAQRFVRLVAATKEQIRECTVDELHQKMVRGDEFYLIDVREQSEWEQGRIPGALHLSKGVIERDIEKHIPATDAEILLYCGGGYRSALAAENLQRMGYENVVSVDGGWRDWMACGYEVERD